MRERLLLAIDQFESGQVAVDFGIGLALRFEAFVKVFHVRELPKITRVPPLETSADAKVLVDEAVLRLRAAGVGADGRSRSARIEDVGVRIVEEASLWQCDAIVLGSVRRRSALPVMVAPAVLRCDTRWPAVRPISCPTTARTGPAPDGLATSDPVLMDGVASTIRPEGRCRTVGWHCRSGAVLPRTGAAGHRPAVPCLPPVGPTVHSLGFGHQAVAPHRRPEPRTDRR